MINLDEYEQDILQSVESGEWESKNNTNERLLELQSYIKNQKKKAISIRVNENDIYELKKKALRKFNTLSKYYSNINTSICNK